ncbi:MAG: hypothetical protein JWM80_3571 [Cyanobacteria bacterium RYN_339]|nr:hypothetical protein [Cyanobacteria bacterium RYN_339]
MSDETYTEAPLALLAGGLADPAGTSPFNPALGGEGGARLMEWLVEGGAIPPMPDDARTWFSTYAEKHLHEVGWPVIVDELKTMAYMRGYDGVPRFLSFILGALALVRNQQDWDALMAYLNWLTQVMLLRATPEPRLP